MDVDIEIVSHLFLCLCLYFISSLSTWLISMALKSGRPFAATVQSSGLPRGTPGGNCTYFGILGHINGGRSTRCAAWAREESEVSEWL